MQSVVGMILIWDTGFPPSADQEECILLCIGQRTIDSEYQGLIISPVSEGANQAKLLFSRIGFWTISSGGEEEGKEVRKKEIAWKNGLKKPKRKNRIPDSQRYPKRFFWEQLQNYVQSEVEEITLV